MIDELGHEAALPSWLGTNRAGLGELADDLAMTARQGKSSRGLSFRRPTRCGDDLAAPSAETPHPELERLP
jgi:hypothetical protein